MKLLEKEFESAQRWDMWFVTNNIDSHSHYKLKGTENVQYGLEIIFKGYE